MRDRSLDRRVAALAEGVDPEIRRELQQSLKTLRTARDPKAVLNGMSRTCLLLTRRLYGFLGQVPPSDNLFDHVEDLKKKGALPAEMASNLHNIRMWSNKTDHGAEQVELRAEDAENALSSFLRVLTWFHCECPSNPARIPTLHAKKRSARARLRIAGWIGGGLFAAALGVALVLVLPSLPPPPKTADSFEVAPAPFPERPRIVIAPLEVRSERPIDARLWSSADRVIASDLGRLDPSGSRMTAVDPLRVTDEIDQRRIPPIRDDAGALELLAAVHGDLVFRGTIQRPEGKAEIAGRLLASDGRVVATPSGTGADLFEAAADFARALCALPDGDCVAPVAAGPADPVLAAWHDLVMDPWTDARYSHFLEAAVAAGDPDVGSFARSLLSQDKGAAPCGPLAQILESRGPEPWGPLATAVCLFRQANRRAEALVAAEKAFRNPRLRRLAAVFLSKASAGAGRSKENRIALVAMRVDFQPDDAEGWWLLANLQAAAGRLDDARIASQVADSLRSRGDIGFNAAANAFHTLLQLMGPALDEETVGRQMERPGIIEDWMRILDDATPEQDWDLARRACRKAMLLQLRGRSLDAQRVLRETWDRLSTDPASGDRPFSIVGTALFYLYLDDGLVHEAGDVLEGYGRRFEDSGKADVWTWKLMDLAHRARRDHLAPSRVAVMARPLAEALEKASKRSERDGAMCLLLSHVGSVEDARILALRAEPENSMMAGCRFRAGEAFLGEGRFQEAIEKFEQARRDILFRSDWYPEFYLPALILEAKARRGLGQNDRATALLEAVSRQYRTADDRLLPRVHEARDLLESLASSRPLARPPRAPGT